MDISFEYAKNGTINNLTFEGLDGREYVTSTKDALNVMKIRNPALRFSDDAKAGCFNEMTDAAYQDVLDMIKCIKLLWRHPDAPDDDGTLTEMNALALLANAIMLVSRQRVQIREYKEEIEDALYG